MISAWWKMVLVLLLALLFDSIGELHEKAHPVVWMGVIIEKMDDRVQKNRTRLIGFLLAVFTIFLFTFPVGVYWFFFREVYFLPLTALIVSSMFSFRFFYKSVKATNVEDIEEKREAVGKLVSRDVEDLDERLLNSASIETAAENLTDSIVSPLFYFALFGLPGIVFFRVVNTLDAMIGYKKEGYHEMGFFSARLDDLLNFIPSRIAGSLILLVGGFRKGFPILKTERGIKINPGWTLSAMSGVLDRRLEKRGGYTVNDDKPFPDRDDIGRVCRIMIKVTFISILISILLIFARWKWFGGA